MALALHTLANGNIERMSSSDTWAVFNGILAASRYPFAIACSRADTSSSLPVGILKARMTASNDSASSTASSCARGIPVSH